jgi:peptidoglycan/LPS O-acetylase OafA/YrhL
MSRLILSLFARSTNPGDEPFLTIGKKMKLAGDFPAGFDYLRVILAVSVVVWHSIFVCYGLAAEAPFWSGWPRPFIFFILPAFFGMGGFLIASSIFRNTVPSFLALRAARIYPALICEILISALILGPQLTNLSYFEYFTHWDFWTYLLNIIGFIHYKLPGVFVTNPAGSDVNTQLWTIPYEIKSYALIAALMLFGVIRRPGLLLVATCLLTLASIPKDLTELTLVAGPPGRLLILSCLWGVILYVWRDRVPYTRTTFMIALVAAWITLSFPESASLSALPVTYIAVWLGVHNPRRRFPVSGTDYSYGIYVYGFPIQQSLAYLLPDQRIWYINASLGVVLAWVAAFVSWNLVEGPIMRRKRYIVNFVNGVVGYAERRVRRLTPSVSQSGPVAPSGALEVLAAVHPPKSSDHRFSSR